MGTNEISSSDSLSNVGDLRQQLKVDFQSIIHRWIAVCYPQDLIHSSKHPKSHFLPHSLMNLYPPRYALSIADSYDISKGFF